MDDLVLIVFPSRSALTKALDHLSEIGGIEYERAAIVAKAQTGEVTVLDDKIGADEGGIAGGTLGAAMAAFGIAQLGALALPGIGALIAIGSAALAGAFVGGLTGRVAGNMIESTGHANLAHILSDRLEAGHPALVLAMKNAREMMPVLRAELEPFKAEVIERIRAE
ncbi:MAG: hypothetical protein KME04_13210 [Pleurocapsa minor GSE-CHR-MK-17-07R]|jgi:uncharacterized membrane protein|nr:hypothetical protein [Pleurocapsa minor GSE-CHR-MK 17-07R]